MTQKSSIADLGLSFELQLTRRSMLTGSLSMLVCAHATAASRRDGGLRAGLEAIQARIGGRLGVHVLDTGSGTEHGLNEGERFAMCSTFKVLLAAAVLARVDAGALSLDRAVAFGPRDIVPYTPVVSKHLAEGAMSVAELCAAAVEVSDNTAANLLLYLIDGPAGLTAFLRALGDEVTRLDRIEPALNSNLPGDPRDTTTPRAMTRTLQKLLVGSVLSDTSQTQLIQWLLACRTGSKRIRAGLPGDWQVGDKTGTGYRGAVNDVLVAWPPDRKPIIAAAYMSGSKLPIAALESAHAEIGGLITQMSG